MTRFRQITAITLACVAAFLTMRMLPVEKCEFLHYGDYVNSEGVIEGCGYEETTFFDMSEIRYPITAKLIPLKEPAVGERIPFELKLQTTTGKPIEWNDIAVSHTERIHAMVIDESLEDYQHVHPQPAGPPGHYLVELTPVRNGPYSVYLDFIPLASSQRTLLKTGFELGGIPDQPVVNENWIHQSGSFRFSLIPQTKDLKTGEELTFSIDVEALDKQPIVFTPVMDAFAHLVAFDAAGTGFAHLHPLNPLVRDQDPKNPDLRFSVQFDKPGYYRIWSQMIVNGRHVFVPFGMNIRES